MLNDYDGMIGIKTGFTFQALLTFVGAAERDGRRIYVIVLGSEGRRGHFADAKLLLDYAFDEMPYYQMISTGNPYEPIHPRTSPRPLLVERDVEAFVHLAGQGIFSSPPAPVNGEEIPEPEPIVQTMVTSSKGPGSFWESITFWFTGGNRN
jgi:D-alanyl-D-alanine carboxypeptidase